MMDLSCLCNLLGPSSLILRLENDGGVCAFRRVEAGVERSSSKDERDATPARRELKDERGGQVF